MATVVAVQAAQLFGIGLLIVAGLAFLGFGPAEPRAELGLHDPGRLPARLRRAVADGAHRRGPRAHRRRGQRARRRHRRQGRPQRRPGRSAGAASWRRPRRRPADPTAVLEVRDLSVSVDDGPQLVTGVSFSLRPGRVLGLVGESGCGKTMTARSLLGLLPDGVSVSGGSILWQGRELVGLPEKELNGIRGREIAMISQEPMVALDPMFSVALPADPADPPLPGRRPRRGHEDRRRAAPAGRHRRRRAGAEVLPAPAVRRHGAAGLHRAGAHRRSRSC